MGNQLKISLFLAIVSTFSWGIDMAVKQFNNPQGSQLLLKVTDRPGNSKDWIGIYHKGANSTWANKLAWTWAKDTLNDKDWYKLNTSSLPKGEYEARFFLNDSHKVEKKVPFAIKNTVTLSSIDHYKEHNVNIGISHQASSSKNWVAIYHAGSTNAWKNEVDWKWSTGKNKLTFTKVPSGKYEARIFYKNSYKLENSVYFTVGNGTVAIKSDKNTYSSTSSKGREYPKTTTFSKRLTDTKIKMPTVGNPSYDNIFGTVAMRVDRPDTIKDDLYPKRQGWNSNMSLIRINYKLFDANTLKESPITKGLTEDEGYTKLCSSQSGDFRWSSTDPNKFYLITNYGYNNLKLIAAKINGNSVDCSDVIYDFKAHGYDNASMGWGESSPDFKDKYIVITVKKENDNKIYFELIDLQNKVSAWEAPKLYNERGAIWIDRLKEKGTVYDVLDAASVTPSGKHILINDELGVFVYDINLEHKRRLEYRYNGKLYSQDGHGDIAYNTKGHEVFVQFIGGVGVYSFDLDDSHSEGIKIIASSHSGGFVSARNVMHKGWCYVWTREEGYQEVFALKLDGSKEHVQRYFQTHGDWYGGTVSPDGKQILFSTPWKKGYDKANPIYTFVTKVQ